MTPPPEIKDNYNQLAQIPGGLPEGEKILDGLTKNLQFMKGAIIILKSQIFI